MENKTIAVWFSCGAASAVAAKMTIEKYGQNNTVRVVNNPVIEEDEDNRRFLKDVEKWLGQEIEIATNPEFRKCSAEEVWLDRNFMSGPMGAPCTIELKKRARQMWEAEHKPDFHVLGFTANEKKRYERFTKTERTNVLPILIEANLTKQDCYDRLKAAGIEPPRIYRMGYPNANCIGCVKATSPTYWNHVRKMHPDVFERRARVSREIGAKLVLLNKKRIFLDELPEDAQGKPMKTMDVECGVFCEEWSAKDSENQDE